MSKKLYKILVNGKSCHGGDTKWSLPTKTEPGKWHKYDGAVKICNSGFHLTTEPFNWYKWGCTMYEAEAKDIIEWEKDKCVCREVRLVKKLPHPKWWTDVKGWINTLKDIAWLKPDGKPNKEWRLFETRDAAWAAAWDAAGDAAWDAAGDAAGVAAWDAVWDAARDAAWAAAGDAAGDAAWVAAWDAVWDAARDAAWAAAGDAAGDAAWDAAGDAAGVAAWDAVWDAARDAAWDAARDASLYSRSMVSDWNFELKHRTHVKARMEVWQKGFGLLCDINGVLYVYKRI